MNTLHTYFRVRADHGLENVDVARLMFMICGTGSSSFISGKSVYNQRFVQMTSFNMWCFSMSIVTLALCGLQYDKIWRAVFNRLLLHNWRIERLWRDLWTAVTCIYYDVLRYLEKEGYLDISNEAHFFCCHYVFLPRLQDDVDTFRSGWDNHPLRTESNMTPNQLWVLGRTHHPIPPHGALTEAHFNWDNLMCSMYTTIHLICKTVIYNILLSQFWVLLIPSLCFPGCTDSQNWMGGQRASSSWRVKCHSTKL